jgi:hypothetical protein
MKIFLLILFVFTIGCSATQPDIATGEFKLYTTVVVTEDWCYMPDQKTRVNGSTTYSPQVRWFSTICVSLKSDDPGRTLKHELDHAWRNAVGLDARWAGHNNVCTAGVC